jgi:crotonobetainyl-CoA:carnitine CoA-transferase CaiB-like acyl-CoA transferase
MATMLLGDQGADVIKVEHGRGDQMRYVGATREGVADLGATFVTSNRNKRSALLDLKSPEGLEAARRLVATADVVVQNFRPGVIDRLGLGYAAVDALRKDVVYVSVDGLGDTGPEAGRRVYDPVIQGMSGICAVQRNFQTKAPQMIQTAAVDKLTALTVWQAVTAGLFARERTGRGQHIKVSMLHAAIAWLWPGGVSNETFLGAGVRKSGTASEARMIYQTKDDYLIVASMADAEFRALTNAIGRPELINDPRFRSITERTRNVISIREVLADAFRDRTTAEWIEILREADVVFSRVNTPETLHLDPQVIATEAILELVHPAAGAYRQPAHPVRFLGTPAGVHRHAPTLGEHTEEVLRELGMT